MKVVFVSSVSTLLFLISLCAVSDSSKCPPGDSYEKDCNTCSCIEKGIYICTQRACYDGSTFPDTDVLTTESPQQDLPTTTLSHPQSTDKRVCTPHDTKMQECNRCTCAANGLRWKCTRRACPSMPKIPLNGEGFACPPSEVFKDDCNTCTCDESGTLARCTAMACDPSERHKRSDTSSTLATTAPTSQPLATTSNPNSSSRLTTTSKTTPKTIGNRVGDNKVATSTVATPTATSTKVTYNPRGTADRVVTRDELKDPSFSCTPSLSFKVDCNTCWCAANGKETRFCTRIVCKPTP